MLPGVYALKLMFSCNACLTCMPIVWRNFKVDIVARQTQAFDSVTVL